LRPFVVLEHGAWDEYFGVFLQGFEDGRSGLLYPQHCFPPAWRQHHLIITAANLIKYYGTLVTRMLAAALPGTSVTVPLAEVQRRWRFGNTVSKNR